MIKLSTIQGYHKWESLQDNDWDYYPGTPFTNNNFNPTIDK